MENRMETFDLGGGWTAERADADRVGMDVLRLIRAGSVMWEMEIPPKMTQTEMLSRADMMAALWDSAFRHGAEACRDYIQQAVGRVTGYDVLEGGGLA